MADDRTVAQIEQELAQTRQRLTQNLSDLISEAHPKAVAARTVAEGKQRAKAAVDEGAARVRSSWNWLRHQFRDESGWNTKTIAIAAAAVTVVVVVVSVGVKKK
ncbi:MAG: DUF3618 domain-containing protein [Propionibacteriaceae bacterium]|jgi:anti-sigma-K factor RskA|nr:DUF3618 domain-containing protein [Propionibacteriaceae bacterium]